MANDKDKSTGKRSHADVSAAKQTTLPNLTKVFKDKIKKTRADLQAKGLTVPGPNPQDDDLCEVQQINQVVKKPAPAAASSYRTAPALTLRHLMPENTIPVPMDTNGGQSKKSKLDSSFHAEQIEIVLMRKKHEAGPDVD